MGKLETTHVAIGFNDLGVLLTATLVEKKLRASRDVRFCCHEEGH